MTENLLGIFHAAIILAIMLIVTNGKMCPQYLAAAEIVLTLVRAIAEKRLSSNRTKIQIVLSLFLGYVVFPNPMRNLGWVFFFKAIELHQTFKSIRKNFWLFSNR